MKYKKILLGLFISLLILILLTQLQPLFLRSLGAVDGTFGLRPVSHECAGITLTGEWVSARLAPADWQKKVGYFSIRYQVPQEAEGRVFCLGQDVWFGE